MLLKIPASEDMTMKYLFKLIVRKIERRLTRMGRKKQFEEKKKSINVSLSSSSSSMGRDFSTLIEKTKITRKEPYQSNTSSTPVNFKVYPLNKSTEECFTIYDQQDFKIYEDFNTFESQSGFSSSFDSFDTISISSDLSGIQIFEDFDDFYEELRREEENIFEPVVFLNSLEIDENDFKDNYEIVTVQKGMDEFRRSFRPRSLKTGLTNSSC